jgi:hypothetical protein
VKQKVVDEYLGFLCSSCLIASVDAKTRRSLRAIDKTHDRLHRLPFPNELLVQLRPGFDSAYISQGRTVLDTAVNDFIPQNSAQGLFVHEARILSCYSTESMGSSLAFP